MLQTILWQADGWKWLISRSCLNHLTVFSGKSNIGSSMVPSSVWVWDSSLWSVVTANSCITSSGIEAANVLAVVSCARMTDGFKTWRVNKSWVSRARLLIILSVVQGTTSITQPELLSLVWRSNQICGWDRRQTGHSYQGAPQYERNFKQVESNSFSWKHHSLFFFSAYMFIILQFSQNGFEFQSQGPGETTVCAKLISFQTWAWNALCFQLCVSKWNGRCCFLSLST